MKEISTSVGLNAIEAIIKRTIPGIDAQIPMKMQLDFILCILIQFELKSHLQSFGTLANSGWLKSTFAWNFWPKTMQWKREDDVSLTFFNNEPLWLRFWFERGKTHRKFQSEWKRAVRVCVRESFVVMPKSYKWLSDCKYQQYAMCVCLFTVYLVWHVQHSTLSPQTTATATATATTTIAAAHPHSE